MAEAKVTAGEWVIARADAEERYAAALAALNFQN